MVNIETGKVVDMLESRDYEDVKKWIESYPNIEIVCRDGSVTYAKAVSDAHPSAIQINDRFHILKNLTDYCKEYIKRTIKHKIDIKLEAPQKVNPNNIKELKHKYQYQTKWELIQAVKEMRNAGYTINQICETLNIGNKSVIKYINISENEKAKYDKKSTYEMKLENNRRRKEELVLEVKELKERGYRIADLEREFNLNRKTIKKYLNSDGNFIHSSLGVSKESKLDTFKEQIADLLNNGSNSTQILNIIKEAGYSGSDSLLRHYISKIRRQKVTVDNYEMEKVERKTLISLLYKDIEKIKTITKEQLGKITNIYPELDKIYQTVKQFKEAIFSKNLSCLESWINDNKRLNIMELDSFIAGLERDIDAVKNAVTYKYSNGLAEGTVNKIKVIKRIMYGRCGFKLLKNKVLLHDYFN